MADKVALDIEVHGAGSINTATTSLKSLKAAIKAATDEQNKYELGTQAYQDAAQRVAELRDQVDDLRDSSRQLQGTGIERSSQAFSNLGEGIRNLDFDKIKIALQGFKSALAATGITLVIAAVGYLIENFDELSKGSGIVGKALRFVGDVVKGAIELFTKFTDLLGFTNSELDKQGDAIKENADKSKEAIESQTKAYDEQIAIMKANGESAFALERKKQELIIETNKRLVEQTIAYVKAGGELNEEQRKLLTEQLTAIRSAKNAEKVIDIEAKNDAIDRAKKYQDDLNKIGEENFKRYKEQQAIRDQEQRDKEAEEFESVYLAGLDDQNRAKLEAQDRYNFEKEQNELELNERTRLANEKLNQEIEAQNAASLKKRQEDEKAALEGSLSGAQNLNGALQGLSDAYLEYKKSTLKKGSAEELAFAKKQFEINKKLQLANAVVQGVQAVLAAYSSGSAIPIIGAVAGPAFAVLAGITAAANIAKIANSKFDGSGGSVAAATTSASPSLPAPVISSPSANVQGTQFDAYGNVIKPDGKSTQEPLRAYVVETDITKTQSQVSSIEQKSKF